MAGGLLDFEVNRTAGRRPLRVRVKEQGWG
jgi:hypothetical protein